MKWPNDVWVDGRKVAGILAESRSEPRWAVLGIGVNVAVDVDQLPEEAAAVAGSLGPRRRRGHAHRAARGARTPARPRTATPSLAALRERDALRGQPVRWQDGEGTGAGIDDSGALLVTLPNGGQTTLSAGEVTLSTPR